MSGIEALSGVGDSTSEPIRYVPLSSRGVNLGGTGVHVPPEFGVGDANV